MLKKESGEAAALSENRNGCLRAEARELSHTALERHLLFVKGVTPA
jgi:hypothetical protein